MIAWLLLGAAFASRPDTASGGYSFEPTDVLATYDGPGGLVRVTYSADGPNQVKSGDTDGSGVPDFVETVATEAEGALALYAEEGFLTPLSEEDMGLGDLGGSPAFDVYLVDFAGVADGWFSTDKCRGYVCSGYMVMENDFKGYGYPSVGEAIRVLTSHELFHAVQSAYNADEPDWMREGTAVWAERLYDPANQDFLWFCDAYLDDVGRALDRPPAGAGSSFIYGTALFWEYLTERFGVASAIALQETMADTDPADAVSAVSAVIAANGSTLEEEWASFVQWNLATGDRAGGMESYPFAADLNGLSATAEANTDLSDENRFYPLAATYYRVDLPGGEVQFASPDDPTGIVFSLHPVADGGADGPVADAVADWSPDGPGVTDLGELAAGGYWLVGAYATHADESVRISFCLGPSAADCMVSGDTGDTGDTGGATDTGKAGPSCGGCAAGGTAAGVPPLGLALALAAMRRRGRADPG